jgi:hypothetical protein
MVETDCAGKDPQLKEIAITNNMFCNRLIKPNGLVEMVGRFGCIPVQITILPPIIYDLTPSPAILSPHICITNRILFRWFKTRILLHHINQFNCLL